MAADSIAFMKMQPPPPVGPQTPAAMREGYRRARLKTQPDLPQVYQVKEYEVPGPDCAIPIRLYRGADTPVAGVLPALVFYHGGGWMTGDLDTHDWMCRSIANKAVCAVISVDYRLAPEHPFPAPYDDALAAMHWVIAHAETLRIDPARISVGGDSAGGNLAAAVALTLRDEKSAPRLRSQILIYPAVDLSSNGNYYGRFTKGVILTDDAVRSSIERYIPDAAQRKDWRASPLLASSLKDLPPTLFILAGYDPLCVQGEAYAARLEKEGVAATIKRFPGQMHGFLSNARLLPKANDAIDEIAAALKAPLKSTAEKGP
jgi:acetyl esterase